MINWENIFKVEAKQFLAMTEREKYVYFLLLQYRSPYLWGKEIPDGADCSGSVCLAIAAATGKVIRTTANELFKKFFTIRNPEITDIQAIFFIGQYDRPHGDRVLRSGEVGHVAGVISEGIVMNVVEPKADIRMIQSLRNSYSLRGYSMEIRGLDRKALQSATTAGSDLFNLDAEFSEYINTDREEMPIW